MTYYFEYCRLISESEEQMEYRKIVENLLRVNWELDTYTMDYWRKELGMFDWRDREIYDEIVEELAWISGEW